MAKAPATSAAAKAAGKVKNKGATKGKPAAKGKKPAAEKEPAIEVGQIVKFRAYKEEPEEAYFQPDDDVYVAAIVLAEDGVTKVIHAIKPEDKDAYDENPDDPDLVIDELSFDEVKRSRGRAKTLVKKEEPPPVDVKAIGEFEDLVDEDDPLSSATALVGTIQKSYFYLGGALALLKHKKKYLKPEYVEEGDEPYTDDGAGWSKFVQDKLGFKEGKARHLIDIYLSFSSLESFDVSRLESIGWAAAAEASKYVTEENVDKIVEAAEEMTFQEFKEHVRETYVTDGTTSGGRSVQARIKKITFSYALLEDAAETVKIIIEEAKKTLGLDSDNDAFEHIMTEWANEHLDPAKAKRAVAARDKKVRELKKAGVEIPGKKKAIAA